jgi:hypothetical protein
VSHKGEKGDNFGVLRRGRAEEDARARERFDFARIQCDPRGCDSSKLPVGSQSASMHQEADPAFTISKQFDEQKLCNQRLFVKRQGADPNQKILKCAFV